MRIKHGISALAAAATLSGCGPSGGVEGCATAERARSRFTSLQRGLGDDTVTPGDAADDLGAISDDLGAAASIAGTDALRAASETASRSAGRLRVALIQGEGGGVDAETSSLKVSMAEIERICAE